MIDHLFIIDPFSTLVVGHDSSMALMRAALLHKHAVWQGEMKDLTFAETQLSFCAQQVVLENGRLVSTKQQKTFSLHNKSNSLVWMRKDPPVDNAYIRCCQLLRLSAVPVLNNPDTILSCDEKLFALEFPDLTPATYVSQNIEEIRNLLNTKKILILKNIGRKGGEGIFLLMHEDKNIGAILEMVTNYGKEKVILQEYLPDVSKGDKRIFLLNGESVGAILRVPKKNEHRANMAAGGSVYKTDVTAKEQKICERLKPRLQQMGIYIVGIDVIAEKLTEINITSPTGLEEIARLDASDPAGTIIRWSPSLLKV